MTNLRGMPQFASWSVPQCHVVVEYDLDVIEKIRYDCYRSESQAGTAEVVGLLLGSYDGVQVRIADHLPFQVNRGGMRGFADQVRGYRHRGPAGQVVVGWYHLARDTNSDLTPDELAFHDERFHEAWNVALLLRSSTSGAIHSRFYLSYPKDPSPAALVETRRHVPPEPLFEDSPPVTIRPQASNPKWVWAVLGSTLALAIGSVFYLGSGQQTAPPPARLDAVRLDVQNRGGLLDVSWDPKPFDGLTGAQLEIRDRAKNTKIPLDPKALANGHYAVVSDSDVTGFRIRANRNDGTVVEGSTTYVMPAAKPSVVPPPASPPESDVVAEAREALRKPAEERRSKKERQIAAAAEESGEAERSKPSKREQSKKAQAAKPEFTPPPAPTSAQLKATDLGPLPQPSVQVQQPEVSMRLPSAPPQAPPPDAPKAAVPQASRAALPSLSGSWGWRPGSRTRSPGTPESIEVRVADTSSGISGTLDARYKSKGRTEHVVFSFSGKMVQGRATFPWTSSDGRRGQIELIRVPELPNVLEIVWSRSGSGQVFDDLLSRR